MRQDLPRPTPPPSFVVRDVVERALAEDLGRGDVTTQACVPPDLAGSAALVAREPLVLAGAEVLAQVFATVDPRVRVEPLAQDGMRLSAGTVAARVSGPAQSILQGERVALNLVQRMSGVATKTRRFVDALPAASKTRIADTRKTTPGLRALERYAVRCGGGHNHRDDLSSAVLIKDNHIAGVAPDELAAMLARVATKAKSAGGVLRFVQAEVDTLDQLDRVLGLPSGLIDMVLLDNMPPATLREGVRRRDDRAPRLILEASGGVALDTVRAIAETGVDRISVGGLTHQAVSLDLGLDAA